MASIGPHWDFVEEFAGLQVAALVLGHDPLAVSSRETAAAIQLVAKRLETAYWSAVRSHSPLDSDGLPSIDLRRLGNDSGAVLDWLNTKYLQGGSPSDFDNQLFHRADVASWLARTGLQSAFAFGEQSSPVNRWPWGDHHTKSLDDLAEAARQFWSGYEVEKPGTAPKNREVADWLVAERGVSRKLADAMAIILRADDLGVGRRPG